MGAQAIAVAVCTCKTCGAEFQKIAIKKNRTEADSWVEWMEQNFTECSACYKARMQAEKEAAEKAAKEADQAAGFVDLNDPAAEKTRRYFFDRFDFFGGRISSRVGADNFENAKAYLKTVDAAFWKENAYKIPRAIIEMVLAR